MSAWSDFEVSLYLKSTFEWTSAPISLVTHNPDVFCVIKFTNSLVDSWAASLSSWLWVWKVVTQLSVRKSRCGLWGLCRSAARMWLAVSSPSCTWALHSVHSGMTGIPMWREPAWRHICEKHQCLVRDTGKQKLLQINWLPAISWCLAVTLREECMSPPYVDLSFKKSSLWSGTICCCETRDNIIMGQADISRPVNPDGVGE